MTRFLLLAALLVTSLAIFSPAHAGEWDGAGFPPPTAWDGAGFPPPTSWDGAGFPPPTAWDGAGFPPPTVR